MDYQAIFERILQTVDQEAYFTPTLQVSATQAQALQLIKDAMAKPGFEADEVRSLIQHLHVTGRIDNVMRLSSLHVLACHPRVAAWEEAARWVGEQELAALELGGANREANLASVERHRGVLSFLRGHYDVALDYFTRALERERSAENLSNILCTLLRLGEEQEAIELLAQIRRSFPAPLVSGVDQAIQADPDLALLRTETSR